MHVNFYATLRPLAGGKTIDVDLPAPARALDVLQAATKNKPDLAAEMWESPGALKSHIKVFINGRNRCICRRACTRFCMRTMCSMCFRRSAADEDARHAQVHRRVLGACWHRLYRISFRWRNPARVVACRVRAVRRARYSLGRRGSICFSVGRADQRTLGEMDRRVGCDDSQWR